MNVKAELQDIGTECPGTITFDPAACPMATLRGKTVRVTRRLAASIRLQHHVAPLLWSRQLATAPRATRCC